MSAKRFFYVCAGLLMLVAAYSLGASRAESQTPTDRVVGIAAFGQNGVPRLAVATESGDVYWTDTIQTGWETAWRPAGNIFGGTVQLQGSPWSKVKESYRK